MEGVSRTAPLVHSSASPACYSSPATAFLVRLDRLSAFVGLRGSVNPFFEVHLLPLDSVFITPTIPFPIVSVSLLCSNNNLVVFSSQSATIIPNNDLMSSKFNSFIDFVSKHSQILSVPLDIT